MKTELRKNERRPLNQPIVYSALNSTGAVCASGVGRALDFSPNGLMVETQEPIKEENLRVRITISDGRSIAADGVVVYSFLYGPKSYRAGIKLVGADDVVDEFIDILKKYKHGVS